MISYRRNRLSALERDILNLLKVQPACSYDQIAAHCECDRSSALIAIKRLEIKEKVVKVSVGRARMPNRYEVLI